IRIGGNHRRRTRLLRDASEGRIDLPLCARGQHAQFPVQMPRGRLRIFRFAIRIWITGIDEDSERRRRCHLAQELQPLRRQRGHEQRDAGDVARGWLKLPTKPYWTGSSPIAKTIGMVEVAALAASAATAPPDATMTATFRRASSSASAGNLLYWPAAHANSMLTLRPSILPAVLRPSRNAGRIGASASADWLLR